jgi:hypothetical protein
MDLNAPLGTGQRSARKILMKSSPKRQEAATICHPMRRSSRASVPETAVQAQDNARISTDP